MHLFNAAVLPSYLKDMTDTTKNRPFFVPFKSSRIKVLIYIIKIHS